MVSKMYQYLISEQLDLPRLKDYYNTNCSLGVFWSPELDLSVCDLSPDGSDVRISV